MGRRTAALLMFAALPVLAACQPQDPDGAAALEPASAPAHHGVSPVAQDDVPAEFRGAFDATGTEPFWAVRIRNEGITILRPETKPVKAPNAGPRMAGPQAVWAAKAGEDPVIVALYEHECSDGMSDKVYSYVAEVQVGDASLNGCADRAQP